MDITVEITSEFVGESGYRTLRVTDIDQYAIDSALDTDADQWSVDIADPFAELIDLFGRDNEIRVRLLADNGAPLLTGFCDVAIHQADGTLSLAGRDFTAVAVDDYALPFDARNVRPNVFIANRAAAKGIPRVQIDSMAGARIDRLFSDGSETEWELWYRIVRQYKRYLYGRPDGTLMGTQLNTYDQPTYFFGTPPLNSGNPSQWLPVEEPSLRKSNQQRLWRVIVYGVRNKVGFTGGFSTPDTSMEKWLKKPTKIISSSTAHVQAQAVQESQDEIFDSKVGARELSLTIPLGKPLIVQNAVAMVNLPAKNIRGLWFIVGVRRMNGTDGPVQEVRLREKGYALSKRVPLAPQLEDSSATQRRNTNPATGDFGSNYDLWFAKAAKEWTPSGIPVDLFNAVLHAICEIETGFRNERARVGASNRPPRSGKVNDDVWYEKPDPLGVQAPGVPADSGQMLEEWYNNFANESGNPRVGDEIAVGPMQLLTRAYKDWADQHANKVGEYDGGRWIEEHNIWAAARALGTDKMAGLPHTTEGLYEAVFRYGDGTRAYAQNVRTLVDQKYLQEITAQYDAAQASTKADQQTDSGDVTFKELTQIPDDVDYYKKGILLQPKIADLATAIARRFRTPLISGWRSEDNNDAAGGATHSDHLCGGAGDFTDQPASTSGSPAMHRLAQWAEAERIKGNFAIVIYGPDKIGPSENWAGHMNHVHISFFRCKQAIPRS